jgi:hypothetical protein
VKRDSRTICDRMSQRIEARLRARSGRRVGPARLLRASNSPCRARVRAGVFSTRYKISSNRSNDQPWMAELGRLAKDGVMSPEQPDQRRTPTKEHLAALEMLEQVGDQVFGFCMSVAFA